MLAKAEFQGQLWDAFANRLAGYALPILQSWIRNGQIFAKLRANRIRYGKGSTADFSGLDKDAAEIIAVEMVARGVVSFKAWLKDGGWNSEGGAALTTAFVRQCLFHFGNAYRKWSSECAHRDELVGDETITAEEARFTSAGKSAMVAYGNPEALVIEADEQHRLLNGLPTDLLRAAFLLQSMNYSSAEIAEILGVSTTTLRNATSRYRTRQRRTPQERDTHQREEGEKGGRRP
jgi:DNA-directed RNA polymerase specialized sigma24 family protein